MKRFLSILLTCLLLTGNFVSTALAESPKNDALLIDIKGHWAEAAINAAVDKGYVNGYPDGTFKPNAEVTRAEFMTMLVKALKLDVKTSGSPWYQPYVESATGSGIYVNDFAANSFDKSIPRKEMAMLAVRAGITGYKKDYDLGRNMYEATKVGIIMGTAPGEVSPEGVTTRAAAVVVIERVLDIKAGKTLATDKYATGAAEILWHKTNIMTMLPRYFGTGNEFDYKAMTSTSGKVACSIDQLVVVDLDNKNDPNRKYVTPDLVWGKVPNFYKIESGAYAVLAISKLTVAENYGQNKVGACTATIYNDGWSKLVKEDFDPKNPGTIYGIIPFDKENNNIKRFADVNPKGGTSYYTSGYIIPKGDFTSDKPYYVGFTGLGSDAMGGNIYISDLNEKYHQ